MKSESRVVWLWLTEPAAAVHDLDERRRIRLFTSVQIVIVLALLPMALRWLPIEEEYANAPFAWQFGLQSVAHELISNALKHAFPDGRSGKVGIELRRNQRGEISLFISDNGVGLPPDLDYGQTASLGLQLVQTLVGQVNGRFYHDNSNGATFTLTFMAALL